MSFYSTFKEQMSRKHPFYILVNRIGWQVSDETFIDSYCFGKGSPVKPIRLMVSLRILKHICNHSDHSD